MKRILIFQLSAFLLLTFSACTGNTSETNQPPSSSVDSGATSSGSDTSENADSGEGGIEGRRISCLQTKH